MDQENIFLLHAILLGAVITLVYDGLRALRRVFPHGSFWISVEDLAFWIFCAAEVFLLMYRQGNGSLRWFAVLGAMLGMIVCHGTAGRLLVRCVPPVLLWLLRPVRAVGRVVKRTAGGAAGRVSGFLAAKRKKGGDFLKLRLTELVKLVKMIVSKQ